MVQRSKKLVYMSKKNSLNEKNTSKDPKKSSNEQKIVQTENFRWTKIVQINKIVVIADIWGQALRLVQGANLLFSWTIFLLL